MKWTLMLLWHLMTDVQVLIINQCSRCSRSSCQLVQLQRQQQWRHRQRCSQTIVPNAIVILAAPCLTARPSDSVRISASSAGTRHVITASWSYHPPPLASTKASASRRLASDVPIEAIIVCKFGRRRLLSHQSVSFDSQPSHYTFCQLDAQCMGIGDKFK